MKRIVNDDVIEEVITLLNSIQKVKDSYISGKTLVIEFDEDIVLYNFDIIKYHLEQSENIHTIINPFSTTINDNQIIIELY
jgi:hypothetical protein